MIGHVAVNHVGINRHPRLIGVLVGIVIVFQVLSADVADHLREYATFKAMGYGQGFFLGVVVEEAIILGVLGFIAGWGILTLMAKVTTLPLFISFGMTSPSSSAPSCFRPCP